MQGTVETLRHEMLIHFGLNLFTPGDKSALLVDIDADKRIRNIGAIFNQVSKEVTETKVVRIIVLAFTTINLKRFYGCWEQSGLRLGSLGLDARRSTNQGELSRGDNGSSRLSEAGGLVGDNGEPIIFYHLTPFSPSPTM